MPEENENIEGNVPAEAPQKNEPRQQRPIRPYRRRYRPPQTGERRNVREQTPRIQQLITVLIPLYNERESLRELYEKIRQ
jgi:hypothetical protein